MTHENKSVARVARVSPAAAAAALTPQTVVTIAVDTAYVAAQQGRDISQGIYMMDNKVRNGSTGEGTLELSTVCNNGSLIGFNVVPIDLLGQFGDSVVITGFSVTPPPGQSGVFTAAGTPRTQPALPGEPAGAWCIGH